MASKIVERYKIDPVEGIVTNSSDIRSRQFSMKGYDKAAVILTAGTQLSTVAQPVALSIVAGPATQAVASFSALLGATATLGMSTLGVLRNVQEFKIMLHGTVATGIHLDIDGTTFKSNSTAETTGGEYWFKATDSTGTLVGLATCIQAACTYLDTTYAMDLSTASAGGHITCRLKDYGVGGRTGCTVITTAQPTSDGIAIIGKGQQAIVEFSAADLVSTASSYTDFAARVVSSPSSVIDWSAVVIREPGAYNSTNSPAQQTIVGVSS